MPYTTLISASELFVHYQNPDWAIIDCRFSLNDPDRGRRAYEEAHIPGAVYAHLDEDLSGPVVPGRTGRHPLPSPINFARTLSRWGIDPNVQVVAYDDAGGAIAARLWWMLRWLGHEAVAVLDGGLPAWERAGYPVHHGSETRTPRRFVPRPRPELVVDADTVAAVLDEPAYCLLDARSPERYRGEHEPIDPVAGLIPGAHSAPFSENVREDGTFLPREALRERFRRLSGNTPPERLISYCGSGVTAAHNLLALYHAGLGEGRLFPGSWSEWITDPDRPVARSGTSPGTTP